MRKYKVFKNYYLQLAIQKGIQIYLFTKLVEQYYLKTRNKIRGGKDIRINNILPSWLIILEKHALEKIRSILNPKISSFQFGFK